MGFPRAVSRDVGTNNGDGFKIFMKLVTVILWEHLIAKVSVSSRTFLKLRGVLFSNTKKADLIELCDIAASLNIEVDPDGLVEDRSDILKQKVTTVTGENSVSPQLIEGSYDISPASSVSIFDIYNYLVSFEINITCMFRPD